MYLFFNKKFLLLFFLFVFSANAATSTKKLQVMLNPFAPDVFYLNDGNGIITDPSAIRPAGAYFLINGLIFPHGTMKKNQVSFLVDRHGHPLSESNSLGRWQAFEKMLKTVDNQSLPPAKSLIMMSEWGLYFDEECHDDPNNIFLDGFARMGVLSPNKPLLEWTLGITGGTGCNEESHSTVSAKLYLAQDGTSLIKIKFSEDIKYD